MTTTIIPDDFTYTGDLRIGSSEVYTCVEPAPCPNNVTMSIDGIEVVFKVTDGLFDVEYDRDTITEAAFTFFECLKDYFPLPEKAVL